MVFKEMGDGSRTVYIGKSLEIEIPAGGDPTPTPTPTPTVTSTPTPTATASGGLIFADGFESGDFSAWDSSTTDGGYLSVTTGAALDVTHIYSVADQLPLDVPLIRSRPFRAPHHTI